jgi:hypothetical protein
MSVWCSGREGFVRGGGHRFEPWQPRSAATLRGTGGWLAGGVRLLNNFLLFVSSRFRKSTVLAGVYVTRQYCGSVVAGAPTSKDSHFSWHKTAGGCCARQHKCVLVASTNRLWSSEKKRKRENKWKGDARQHKCVLVASTNRFWSSEKKRKRENKWKGENKGKHVR